MIWPIKRYGCVRRTGKRQSSPASDLGFFDGFGHVAARIGPQQIRRRGANLAVRKALFGLI
jgi:hypothetical protein